MPTETKEVTIVNVSFSGIVSRQAMHIAFFEDSPCVLYAGIRYKLRWTEALGFYIVVTSREGGEHVPRISS